MVFWQKFAHKSVIIQQNFAHKNVILSWKFPHKNVIAIKKVLWPRKTFSENPQKTARFRIKYAPKSVLFFCQGPYQKVANFCIKKLPISVSENRQFLYSHLSLEKCHFLFKLPRFCYKNKHKMPRFYYRNKRKLHWFYYKI